MARFYCVPRLTLTTRPEHKISVSGKFQLFPKMEVHLSENITRCHLADTEWLYKVFGAFRNSQGHSTTLSLGIYVPFGNMTRCRKHFLQWVHYSSQRTWESIELSRGSRLAAMIIIINDREADLKVSHIVFMFIDWLGDGCKHIFTHY